MTSQPSQSVRGDLHLGAQRVQVSHLTKHAKGKQTKHVVLVAHLGHVRVEIEPDHVPALLNDLQDALAWRDD